MVFKVERLSVKKIWKFGVLQKNDMCLKLLMRLKQAFFTCSFFHCILPIQRGAFLHAKRAPKFSSFISIS